jgi:hypothetical protein
LKGKICGRCEKAEERRDKKNEILKEGEWDRRRTLDLGSVRRKGEQRVEWNYGRLDDWTDRVE